jgi:SAM-dependent methyltransferase
MAMYGELAGWWPLLSAPEDYAEEIAIAVGMMQEHARRALREVLELGSGGGNNASHLKQHFTMTLSELSPAMIATSQALNRECEHIQGDMRSLRLDRDFDAVFVHDAVQYMTTRKDLFDAMLTARVHTRSGGVAIFLPDEVKEDFIPQADHGGHDHADGRGLRYVEWTWDPDPNDDTYVTEYGIIVRESDGSTRMIHDRHTLGLFSSRVWIEGIRAAGFADVHVVREPRTVDWQAREVFIGIA